MLHILFSVLEGPSIPFLYGIDKTQRHACTQNHSKYSCVDTRIYEQKHFKCILLAVRRQDFKLPANLQKRAVLPPGTLPVIFVTETMMNHVAKAMNKSPDEIREINFYKKGQVKVLLT